MSTLFDRSVKGRINRSLWPDLPHTAPLKGMEGLLRDEAALLPEVSELELVRHYTQLSQRNFAIDGQFYPLGSCTMKYNPRVAHRVGMHPGLLGLHPYAPIEDAQGVLACLYELQQDLCSITGMKACALSPMAGAQGEWVGVAMIRAYHQRRGDFERLEMLVPDAAHGTNPASAHMCGLSVREVPTLPSGDLDLEALAALLGPQTAGIMLTNPSTLGLFERNIDKIAQMVHEAGGLLYYDGANLNAIAGQVRPGDMGFDVMHMNLHKTFATPHGGGGPGAGPVACGERLVPFLPSPMIVTQDNMYRPERAGERPDSIGQLSAFMGNVGVLVRAWVYIRLLGADGVRRLSWYSTLNANYLQHQLAKVGYPLAYPKRKCAHEFIVTLKNLKKAYNVSALDIAKAMLDHNIHAPTMYFPLLIEECLLIEPTETESLQELDGFVAIMKQLLEQAKSDGDSLRKAPHNCFRKRLDEVLAARSLDLIWQEDQ